MTTSNTTKISLFTLLASADEIVIDGYVIDSVLIDEANRSQDGFVLARCVYDDEDYFLRDEEVELVNGSVTAKATRDLGEWEDFYPRTINFIVKRPLSISDVLPA